MQLVSVSTTLATNAVVENRFSPVATVLIGFDEGMLERSELQRDGAGPDHLGGAVGTMPPVTNSNLSMSRGSPRRSANALARMEGYAVAACFSVRNPAHELRARQLIRDAVLKTRDLRP